MDTHPPMPRSFLLLLSSSTLRANGASDPNPTTIGQSPRGRHAHSRLPHGARAGQARSLQRRRDSRLSVGEIGRSVYLPLPARSPARPPVGPRFALSLPLTSAAGSQDGGCDERVPSRKHRRRRRRRRRCRAEWSAERRAAWPSWMTIFPVVVGRQSAAAHHSTAAAAAAAAAPATGAADGHPPLQIGGESSWARTKVQSN